MNKEKAHYNPTLGDYNVEILTDIHSPETNPSSYLRNINHSSLKDDLHSNSKNVSDTTEKIPTLSKYSNMNKDDDEFEYKGEIWPLIHI